MTTDVLTFTSLWANLADDKLMIFFSLLSAEIFIQHALSDLNVLGVLQN